MNDDGEKKTILGYVSAYLMRPLRSLSEVEGNEAPDPPACEAATPTSYPSERRATRKSRMHRGK